MYGYKILSCKRQNRPSHNYRKRQNEVQANLRTTVSEGEIESTVEVEIPPLENCLTLPNEPMMGWTTSTGLISSNLGNTCHFRLLIPWSWLEMAWDCKVNDCVGGYQLSSARKPSVSFFIGRLCCRAVLVFPFICCTEASRCTALRV